jgi:diguanylate cyclase (GGDEF)-like protein
MDSPLQLIDSVAATTGHRDRDEIELSLVQLLQQFLDAESVALLRMTREGGAVQAINRITIRMRPDGSSELIRDPAVTADAARRAAWLQCSDSREAVEYADSNGGVATAFPVVTGAGEHAALLDVRSRNSLQPRDALLVRGILRIIRNHLDVLESGERDTLTGLLNRKTFEVQFDKLRQELHAQEGNGEPSWMGLVDVDRFKSVNDRYGHLFGDEVLLIVSQVLQRAFRSSDRVYRFGGEEFVILLHHVPENAATAALERLRAAIEAHQFPQIGSVTVSIGWTRIQPQDGPTTCMERADAALYYAKDAGRNQVCRYEKLLEAGKLKAASDAPEVELF